jgi:hypothetical protein
MPTRRNFLSTAAGAPGKPAAATFSDAVSCSGALEFVFSF